MPKVGNTNEALLERALFGFDGTLWRPIKVDTNGNLVNSPLAGVAQEVDMYAWFPTGWVKVACNAAGQLSVAPAPDSTILTHTMTYYGNDFTDQPIIPGFGDALGIAYENLSMPAGTSTFDLDAVPAGSVHVITNVLMRYVGTITSVTLRFNLKINNTAYTGYQVSGITTGVAYDRQGQWFLNEGDNIQLMVFGATLNDDFYAQIVGYKFSTNV